MSAVPPSTMLPSATGAPMPPRNTWSRSASPPAQLNVISYGKEQPGLPGARRSLLAAESPHPHRGHGASTEIALWDRCQEALCHWLVADFRAAPKSETPAEKRRIDESSDYCVEYTAAGGYRRLRTTIPAAPSLWASGSKATEMERPSHLGLGGGHGRFHPCDQLRAAHKPLPSSSAIPWARNVRSKMPAGSQRCRCGSTGLNSLSWRPGERRL